MEQQAPTPRRSWTVAQYLAMEAASEERHEFRDGDVLDMAGAATPHVRVATNLTWRLAERLQGSGCEVLGSDQRVRSDRTRYCYPDLTVACQPLAYDPPDGDVVLTNPRVVIEILSAATEAADRGEKFTRYRNLESLQEYLLVAQDRPQIEPFHRQADGTWAIGRIVTGLDATFAFRSLPKVELPLAQVYAGVTFSPPPEVGSTTD